ncbi:hypothetical protein ACFQ08_26140, partial [Streptosporangium algeriense]
MLNEIHVHRFPEGTVSSGFEELLSARRKRLSEDLALGRIPHRTFPVLAVLAPVMTQAEGEITYPGDPMCLYAALSVTVRNAVRDAGPLEQAGHYNDLAPGWTRFPDRSYRMSVGEDGYRPYTGSPNTDQTVFDPRVWDREARERWIGLLRETQPRVVLISSVSPAHRYALNIAGLAKSEVPGVYVILGGRHVDETTTCVPGATTLMIAPSSTLAVMDDGRVPHVVDATVSGEAYHSLDLLMRAVALSVDLDSGWVAPSAVRPRLEDLLRRH